MLLTFKWFSPDILRRTNSGDGRFWTWANHYISIHKSVTLTTLRFHQKWFHSLMIFTKTGLCGRPSAKSIYNTSGVTDLGSVPKGDPSWSVVWYERQPCTACIAAFAQSHDAWMLVQFECDFGFERRASAFKDDFWTKFVSHAVLSEWSFSVSITDYLRLTKTLPSMAKLYNFPQNQGNQIS